MDNASCPQLDDDLPRFVPALSPYLHSRPVPARYLKGYFSKLEPRISCVSDQETDMIHKVHQEWSDRGGCPTGSGALSRAGGFMSLLFPESVPERLFNTCALSALGFIEDGKRNPPAFIIKCTQRY
jgi:hypothetical protein